MLFRLALRNLAKTLPKRLTFGSFFAVTMALLFLGNTVFENSDRGLSSTYVNSFTGQASLSASSPEEFTIFGSDLPLIGEFLVLPVLPDADGLRSKISKEIPGAQYLPQVSAAGVLALGNYSRNVPVFGVDFPAYFRFFPALKLLEGSLPSPIQSSILLTKPQAEKIAKSIGRPLVLGEKLTLSFAVQTSFVIREVAFSGVYEYPSGDQFLDRIVLTDPDTARALNGYLYGGAEQVSGPEKTDPALGGDLDSLFSGAADTTEKTSGTSMTPDSVAKALADAPAAKPVSGKVEGAWNFLLVKEEGRTDQQTLEALGKTVGKSDLQVRDWRDTAGGTAKIAYFLRIIFNLGLIFIAVVSCLILINSLSLSILERTREIGTMRALGAEKSFVGGLIAWETLVLVVGMGLLGILLGCVGIFGLNTLHLTVDNVYISSLFGSRVLHLDLSWSGIVGHGILSVVLGVASVAFPVRKALEIQPVKAIAREQ